MLRVGAKSEACALAQSMQNKQLSWGRGTSPPRTGRAKTMSIDRRKLLTYGAGLAGGAFLDFGALGQTKPVVNMQLGWILGGNQIG
jgi:hypothetical protein